MPEIFKWFCIVEIVVLISMCIMSLCALLNNCMDTYIDKKFMEQANNNETT